MCRLNNLVCIIVALACLCGLSVGSSHNRWNKVVMLDDAAAEGAAPCLTVEFPTPFKAPVSFNMSEGVGPIKDETADLQCHCAEMKCDCTGTTPEDCDEYAEGWLYFIGMAHQLGFVFYKMSEYNFASMIYWGIFGIALALAGICMVLYMEIRTVICTRQKDERKKLEEIRAMERSNKLILLEQEEAAQMKPRPYVTTTGTFVFFLGLFCQLVPFCHLLRDLGLPVAFPGFCILFVFTSAFMLSSTTVLILMGCIWSCTRAFPAMLFIVLGLFGNVIIFYGFIPCLIWALCTIAALFAYFKFLPEWWTGGASSDATAGAAAGAAKPSPPPFWLQDIGDFTLEAEVDRIREAWAGTGHLVATDLSNTNPLADGRRHTPIVHADHRA